ncbi:MAG TPA: NTP transferase domain-containing protein [Candidatus Limnocylindrales bacterium]|nr:NTP transferase domain-containing protein [Candidatus Limnocylindrales bacterium]
MDESRVRAVVLAAGAGDRFGGRKLGARIAGRAVLQHVLDRLADAGLDDPIVVLSPDSPLAAQLEWRRAARVVNPDPARGLASSLQLGWAAAMAGDPRPDAVLVVLGDQPRLAPEVVRAIVAAPLDPSRPVVAPNYAESGARNPMRLEREAARLVEAATGDRGIGPQLAAEPLLVRWLAVDGDNPDIDRAGDLVAAIEADWAGRVRRNRDQVDRLRETRDDADHYAPVAGLFRDDPRRTGDDVLERLLSIARPTDTWLDVGAGAGRYAFPLALAVREVVALDPSAAMVAALADGKRDHGIVNVRIIDGRWPAAASTFGSLPVADVSFIANVGHDTEEIGPFVAELDAAARRECVAVMQEHPPAAPAAPFFEAVHGERREPLPALNDFVDLLVARGTPPDVELLDRPSHAWRDRDEILTFLRRQTWVVPGSAGDARLQQALDAALDPDGSFRTAPSRVGIVRWTPATSGRSRAT